MYRANEKITGDSAEMQRFISALNKKVSLRQNTGQAEYGAIFHPRVIPFIENAFSVNLSGDGWEINNDLKITNKVYDIKPAFDSISTLKYEWFINNTPFSEDGWHDIVDSAFLVKDHIKKFINLSLRFTVRNIPIIEYRGTLRIGGFRAKAVDPWGTSLTIDMDLKYADISKYSPSVDRPTNRYKDLDFEYRVIRHQPLKSFFLVGSDIPLFSSYDDSISQDDISYIALTVSDGNILSPLEGIQGDRKKVVDWVSHELSHTDIEIEGMKVWDGKSGSIKPQTRLVSILKDEVAAIPRSDSFSRVMCDIKVLAYNKNNELSYTQGASLQLRRTRVGIVANIISEDSIKTKSHNTQTLELERLERDNNIVRDIQSKFDSRVSRRLPVGVGVLHPDFSDQALYFLKDTKNFIEKENGSITFSVSGSLDGGSEDIFKLRDLSELDTWKDFLGEMDSQDLSDAIEAEFDFSVTVSIPSRRKNVPILTYKGTFSVEVEGEHKATLHLSLRSSKLPVYADIQDPEVDQDKPEGMRPLNKKDRYNQDREYIGKSAVNRFSTLDF